MVFLATLGSDLGQAAATVSAAGVVLAAAGWVRVRYKSSLGQRKSLAQKLGLLTSGVRIEYVENLLGPSTFRSSRNPDETEDVFVTDFAHVQTITNRDGTILLLAITVVDRRFKPNFLVGLHGSSSSEWVTLGKTTFGGVARTPERRQGWYGGHRFEYLECFSLGNPGGYRRYLLGNSSSGVGKMGHLRSIDGINVPREHDELEASESLERFRSETVINTYAVTAPHILQSQLDSWGAEIGNVGDLTRLLPMQGVRRWRRKGRFRSMLRAPNNLTRTK